MMTSVRVEFPWIMKMRLTISEQFEAKTTLTEFKGKLLNEVWNRAFPDLVPHGTSSNLVLKSQDIEIKTESDWRIHFKEGAQFETEIRK